MNYLLTFNENWADEHNVPALACMTEEEYKKWLEIEISEKNEDYEEEMEKFKKDYEKYRNYEKGMQKKGLYKKPHSEWSNTEREWEQKNTCPYVSRYDAPEQFYSNLCAYLGNSGERFAESFNKYRCGKDFVEAGIVKVTEVDDNFKIIFDKANLANLSLCNIFESWLGIN